MPIRLTGHHPMAVPIHKGPVHKGPVHKGPVHKGPVHKGPVPKGPVHKGPVELDHASAPSRSVPWTVAQYAHRVAAAISSGVASENISTSALWTARNA
jgi:hypothetical protein